MCTFLVSLKANLACSLSICVLVTDPEPNLVANNERYLMHSVSVLQKVCRKGCSREAYPDEAPASRAISIPSADAFEERGGTCGNEGSAGSKVTKSEGGTDRSM